MIFLQYCYSAQRRVLISTGIAIPPSYWNVRTSSILQQLPTEYGNVDTLETASNAWEENSVGSRNR